LIDIDSTKTKKNEYKSIVNIDISFSYFF